MYAYPCHLAIKLPLPFVQKLVRMNMPVAEDGTVHFTTTLFALIRESLMIKTGPGISNTVQALSSLLCPFRFVLV